MRVRVLWIFSISILIGLSAVASEGMRIVFPRSVVGVVQHGNLMIVVNYEKADTNRILELVWDSEDESGSSVLEITTKNNGIPFSKDLNLSVGEYTFVATLYRSDSTKIVTKEVRFVTR